jgi:hypothetical protein
MLKVLSTVVWLVPTETVGVVGVDDDELEPVASLRSCPRSVIFDILLCKKRV